MRMHLRLRLLGEAILWLFKVGMSLLVDAIVDGLPKVSMIALRWVDNSFGLAFSIGLWSNSGLMVVGVPGA